LIRITNAEGLYSSAKLAEAEGSGHQWIDFCFVGALTAAVLLVIRSQLEILLFPNSRIGKGISAQALHKTVRASLNAYGFCHSVHEESQTLLSYTLSSHSTMVVLVSTIEQPEPFALSCFHRMSSLLRFSPQLLYASVLLEIL